MSASVILISSAFGGLDLERLVDQVAEHLLAQAIELVGGNLAAIGDREQREPLVDVGLGDDVAVDDRGRLDDRRHGVCRRTVDLCGRLKRAGAVGRGCVLRRVLGRCAESPRPSTNAAATNRAAPESCRMLLPRAKSLVVQRI